MTSCDLASRRANSSVAKSTEAAKPEDIGGRIALIGIKIKAILSLSLDGRVAGRVALLKPGAPLTSVVVGLTKRSDQICPQQKQ